MSPTIEQRNREKHTTEQDPNNNQNNLHEQDQELQSRILNLNTHIKRLNQSAGRVVPDLNKDLYKVQKSAPNTDKGHQHQLLKTSLVYTRTVYTPHTSYHKCGSGSLNGRCIVTVGPTKVVKCIF